MPRIGFRRAYSFGIAVALALPALQRGPVSVLVIEYRGPSNEFVAPIVLALPDIPCDQVQQMVRRRLPESGLPQCPFAVTPAEMERLTRNLRSLGADTVAMNTKPALLRATMVSAGSDVTESNISEGDAFRALDVVAQQLTDGRHAPLRLRLTEFLQRVSSLSPMVTLPMPTCGQRSEVDEALQGRIIDDLMRLPPTWSVAIRTSSNTSNSRLLDLTSGAKRVWVGVSYLASPEHAERDLRCRLMMIAMPRFRRVEGIGDEAFVMTESVLLFRTGAVVFYVQSFDKSLDAEKELANRLIASTQTR